MSLLDDVSIVVTPNGYKAGELYAVIPVPTEGAEEVTNGDFATDSDWTKSGGATISGGQANIDGDGTSYVAITQTNVFTEGKRYKVTADVIITSGLGLKFQDGANNENIGFATTTGSYEFYFIATSNTSFVIGRRTGGTAFDSSIDNVSVKEYTAADMDVTRATAATRVDENGLVNYAEVIGDSALTGNNSNFDTGIGSWVGYNGGTLAHSTDKLEVTLTTGESGAGINTNSLISGGQAGKIFKVRAKIWQGTSTNSTILIFMGGSQKAITISSTPTYFEIELTPSNTGSLYIYRSGGSGGVGTYFIDDVTVKEVTRDNVPRIDYTGGGCPHILAEPQRTNLITYSEDFSDSSWSKNFLTATTNVTTSPNGVINADLIESTSTSSSYIAANYPTLTATNTYTFSVFAKKGNNNWIRTSHHTSSSNGCWFDLENGVVGTINSTSAKIEDYGNGWYKCSNTFVAVATTLEVFIGICDGNNSTNAGASGQNDYIWGAQLEAGSYETSYIPTSGSTVTRNQDQFTRDGIGSLINSTEGVLFAEIKSFISLDAVDPNRYITLTNGTSNERVALLLGGNNNQLRAIIFSNSQSINLSFTTSLTDTKQFNKLAIKYKSGDYAFFLNGEKIGSNSETNIFATNTLNNLSLDVGGGTQQFRGMIKQLQVFKTALTDSELIALTT